MRFNTATWYFLSMVIVSFQGCCLCLALPGSTQALTQDCVDCEHSRTPIIWDDGLPLESSYWGLHLGMMNKFSVVGPNISCEPETSHLTLVFLMGCVFVFRNVCCLLSPIKGIDFV